MKKFSIKALFYGVLLTFVIGTKVSSSPNEKPMVIVSCGYNNKNYYIKNLESTLNQNYKNYRIIYVDDASPDGTADLVKTYLINHNQTDKVTLIHNNHRQGSLANLTHAIYNCKDNEIIVRVDADDWLADANVLSRINEAYRNEDIWLTYGNYKGTIWPHKEGGSFQIPTHVIESNEFRNHLVTKFDASHLVTYYAWLFKKIKLEDLLFKDEFWPCAPDLMTIVPMLEMAGKHSIYIPEILYIWNNDNPLNEFKGDCHATTKHKGNIYLRIVQNLQERPGYEPLDKAPTLEQKRTIENEKPIVIISCGYNHKNYFEKNLESTLNQNYSNYRIIYIDDASPDYTGQLVEDYLKTNNFDHKVTLIRNRTRLGLMANLYQAIHKCQDHEIVVMVDADDWLADGNVLSFINNVYQDENVWLTYGSFIDTNGNKSGTPRSTWEVPQEVINQNKFREHDFITGHLRTFYASLFKKIKLEDFLYEDKFFPVISDVVKMFPMLEMASNHIKFIPDILYIWNTFNPINENKTSVHKDLSKPCHDDLLKRKKYQPLNILPHEQAKQDQTADLVIFSYDRPLQLYAYLESLQTHVKNLRATFVLYKSSDNAFDQAYDEIKKNFPQVHFVQQTRHQSNDFKSLLLNICFKLSQTDHILFGVDDMIVTDSIDMAVCTKTLEETDSYCCPLRLGKNIDQKSFCIIPYDTSHLKKIIELPILKEVNSSFLIWNFDEPAFMNDWTYPHSVDMVLFRKKDIEESFRNLEYKNPNDLEGRWVETKHDYAHKTGLCPQRSATINIPLNNVREYKDATKHMNFGSTKDLLNIFNQGLKIDIKPFFHLNNRSPHEEHIPTFITR